MKRDDEKMTTSIRYCMTCEKIKRFRYIPATGHSECQDCGNRLARNPENIKEEEIFMSQIKKRDEKIADQREEITKLNLQISSLKKGFETEKQRLQTIISKSSEEKK